MATVEIKVPSPGESVSEVEVARWLVDDGAYVEKDEEIAEIDSEKATLSIVAEKSGTLKILVREGEAAKVGAVLCTIDTSAKAPAGRDKGKRKDKDEGQARAKAGDEDGKKERGGDDPKKNREDAPAKAPAAGDNGNAATAPAPEAPAAYESDGDEAHAEHASPVAERMMKENRLSPSQVRATGQGGRITKADVLKALEENRDTGVPAAPAGARGERREKMSMLRRKVSERLVAVRQQTAMLTTFNEVDMSAIVAMRRKYKEAFKDKYEVGLGYMSFFTRAVCGALRAFPAVNARIDGDTMVYHDYCDIGIAVSTPRGLMVPVIRNAESLAMAEIEMQVLELATLAREGKLSIEAMSGGTFTITNGGIFGSMLSTPILNPPQSAILGMHNIVDRPVAVAGEVVIRPVMYVALSYDHRIIDGRESVSFLMHVKESLEAPLKLLFQGGDPEKRLLGL